MLRCTVKKLVYGKGYNDGSRPAGSGGSGRLLKEYTLWCDMLRRCFDNNAQSLSRNASYVVCSVSCNFLNYAFFHDWCQNQIGFGNVDEKGRSWQLDKDILIVGNKTYNENTCVFLPQEINTFFISCYKPKGKNTLGVYFDTESCKYKAQCQKAGKVRNLGRFNTPEEAFAVYKPFKENLCKQLALKWESEIDPRLFTTMMKWEVKSN